MYTQESAGLVSGANDSFGASLAVMSHRAGGKSLAIGIPHNAKNGVTSGRVAVMGWVAGYLFQQQNLDNSSWSVGSADGDEFGWSLAAGDFDGDGNTDLAVGSPESTRSPNTGGAVYYFHDNATSGQLDPQWKSRPPETVAHDQFGYAVAAGNIDGVGAAKEIAVGAPGRQSGAGKVSIFAQSGASGTIQMQRTSSSSGGAGDGYGHALAVGDIDGNGAADIVIGAPYWNNNQGRITILNGGATVTPRTDYTVAGGWQVGTSVVIGNFHDAPVMDIAVGAAHGSGRLIQLTTLTNGLFTPFVFSEETVGLW
jgi:hypothetical protein